MKKKVIKILGLGFLFLSMHSIAATENLNFTVKVDIYEKICDINDNKPIDVDFGDMFIKDVDGVNYERPVEYTLDCEDGDTNPDLKLRFENNAGAPFDPTLLNTSDRNVGILIKAGGNKLPLGEWVSFSYNSSPALTATPVPSGTGGIDDGRLTAIALLTVEYE